MNPRMWGIIGGVVLVLALLSPLMLGSSKKVERLYEAAEALYEGEDYEGAIVKYNEALKESSKLGAKTAGIDKDFPTLVNFKIARCYYHLVENRGDASHYEKALEHVESATLVVNTTKHDEELIYLWGQILYKTGQLEQAVEKLTQLTDNFPNSPLSGKAQEIIADINRQRDSGEREKVVYPTNSVPPWINDLSKFEAFNKNKNSALVDANRFRANKQYVKAAEEYEAFASTSATKEAMYAMYWAGWCYHEAASDDETLFSQSINVFQRLIDNYGDSPYASKASEKLHKMEGNKLKIDADTAITTAEAAVHRAKQLNCTSALIRKAMTHLDDTKQALERGNYKAALQLAKETEEIATRAIDNHETAKDLVTQGYTHFRRERLETATQKAREALRRDPAYQNANTLLQEIKQKYFRQGVSYIETGGYAKAISALKKAINIDHRFKEAHFNLGIAYLNLGEFEDARAAADAALAIDPMYKEARRLRDSIAD